MVRCKKYITIGTIVVVTALSFQTTVLPLRAMLWAMTTITFAEINPPSQFNEIEELNKQKVSPDKENVPDNHAPLDGYLGERDSKYSSALLDSPPVPPPDLRIC